MDVNSNFLNEYIYMNQVKGFEEDERKIWYTN